MLSSLLNSNNNNIGKLFSSSSTKVDEVLAREDLLSYIELQRENGKGMSSILGFVERNAPKLVLAALHSNSLTVKSPNTSVKNSSNNNNNNNINSSKKCQPSPGLLNKNATELITFYLTVSNSPQSTISCVVQGAISILGNTEVLSPLVAQCFQRLLLAAFEVSPSITTEIIAVTLNENIIIGTIRNISTSFIISETIIAIFGSALRAAGIVSPEIRTQMFTEAWIQSKFPKLLISYMPIALRSTDHQPYFYFLKELLKRGFSHSAGPIVDVILEYEVILEVFKSISDACREVEIKSNSVPLIAKGVEVINSVISLIRLSIIPSDLKEIYNINIIPIAPIKCMQMYAKSFSDIIISEKIVNPSLYTINLQINLCEIFVEILRFGLRETDRIIVESNFLENLLIISLKYPESNRLSILLKQAFLSLLTIDMKIGENLILNYLISLENMPEKGILSKCVDLCANESIRHTSLSAYMIDLYQTLIDTEVFKESFSPLNKVIENFRNNLIIQKRIEDMEKPITGLNFTAPGSGCQLKINHRPLVNHTGSYLGESTLSLSSPSAGSPPAELLNTPPTNIVNQRAGVYLVETVGNETIFPDDIPPEDPAFSASNAILGDGEDTVTVELEWPDEAFEKEISPQVRAYPKFGDMHISFDVRDENYQEKQNDHDTDIFIRRRNNPTDPPDADAWMHETIAAVSNALRTRKGK